MNLLGNVFTRLTLYIPTKNVISFNSYPDFTDNAFAVFLYMFNNHVASNYKFVWLITEKKRVEEMREIITSNYSGVRVVSKRSLIGFYYYIISRYVFYTHGCYDSLKTIQHKDKMVNLWHGMPLKKIGFLDNKDDGYMANSNILIATSEVFRNIMSKSFNFPIDKVWLIGQPRNDLFYSQTNFFDQRNIKKEKYESIGIWLPTYRSSIIGDVRNDGCFNDGQISFLSDEDLISLDNFLYDNSMLLLIKLHPMDVLQNYNFLCYKNIVIIKQNDFNSQLYPLIGACNYMLTDYSSAWVDFDICEKPIGFVINDYEEYKNKRGFNFCDKEDLFPGPVLSDLKTLKEFIQNPYCSKTAIKDKFNKYKDANSSKRLLEKLCLE